MKQKGRGIAFVMALTCLLCAMVPAEGFATQNANGPYQIDNGGFPMSVLSFMGQVPHDDGQTVRVTLNGADVDMTANVATGQTLVITDPGGMVVSERPIAVIGDVTGSGEAGLDQVVRLAGAIQGRNPFDGVWALAADISRSGAVDLTDLIGAASEMRALANLPAYDLTSKTVPLYLQSPDNSQPVTVYFVDGQTDIPYVSLDLALELAPVALEEEDPDFKLTVTSRRGVTRAIRENGAMLEVDPFNDTMAYTDVNWFYSFSFAATCLDVLTRSGEGVDGQVDYFTRQPGSFERVGHPVLIDLSEYDIDIVYQDGATYIPLQTVSDVLYGFTNAAPILYNGEKIVVLDVMEGMKELADLMYSAPTGTRSPELAEFTYNELCLSLDIFYGLKEQHNIGFFDDFFEETGLRDALLSPDPAVVDRAVAELTYGYFGDLHSALISPSYLAGKDAQVDTTNLSPAVIDMSNMTYLYSAAREEMRPNGVPGYEEIGNTAFVTFDSFTMPDDDVDYYTTPPTADATDCVGLIMYAHSQIMRPGSPIENVVIDLSNNGGGDVSAAVYVVSWYLGGTCAISVNDTFSGAQASNRYAVDANRDHKADKDDIVATKNLYCLISPLSFSCGNLVPAAFKESNLVTLVGAKSGGGACIVHPMSMADGTLLQVSGSWRFSNVSNGSFYDVDRGIEPDVSLTRIQSFYDREALVPYLNGLMR